MSTKTARNQRGKKGAVSPKKIVPAQKMPLPQKIATPPHRRMVRRRRGLKPGIIAVLIVGVAIIGLGVWSAVLVCAGELGSFSALIGGVIFIGWIFYGLGAAAIFPFRRASAGRPIPYRVPGYPWTPILFVLAAAAIVINAIYLAFRDPSQFKNLAVAILLFLIGLPAYFFWRNSAASS